MPLRKSFVFKVEGKERKKENKESVSSNKADLTSGAAGVLVNMNARLMLVLLRVSLVMKLSGEVIGVRALFGDKLGGRFLGERGSYNRVTSQWETMPQTSVERYVKAFTKVGGLKDADVLEALKLAAPDDEIGEDQIGFGDPLGQFRTQKFGDKLEELLAAKPVEAEMKFVETADDSERKLVDFVKTMVV